MWYAPLSSPSRSTWLILTSTSAVSQFTLLASTKKGNKPDFHKSAPAAKGKELYDSFIGQVRKLYREDRVKDGVFQAMMDVGLVNDGPVGVDYRCEDEAVHSSPSVMSQTRLRNHTLTVLSRSQSRSKRTLPR